MDFRRPNCVGDDESKLKEKHQGLLREYLVLQKECVLKKRKLKETNERKMTLMDELRFLKHRRDILLKKPLQNSEQQQEIMQSLKTDGKFNVESSRRYMNGSVSASASASASASTSGHAFQNQRPPVIPSRKLVNGDKEETAAFAAAVYMGKKAKTSVTNGKRPEKRKISWQDQLVFKV